MNKLFLNTILALAVMNAAPTGNQISGGSDDRVIPFYRFGYEKGLQREMAISYTNTTGVTGELAIEFRDHTGKITEIPFKTGDGGVTRLKNMVTTLKPYTAGVFTTLSTGLPYQQGWLRVVTKPAGAVTVTALARSRRDGESEMHNYTLYPLSGQRVQTMGPFDDGSEDQFLLANNGAELDKVTMIVRTRAGVEACRTTVDVPAAHWYKVAISQSLPCAAKSQGLLEVQSLNGRTVATIFVFPPSGGTIPMQPAQTAAATNVEEQLTDLWERLKKSSGLK